MESRDAFLSTYAYDSLASYCVLCRVAIHTWLLIRKPRVHKGIAIFSHFYEFTAPISVENA